MVSSLLDCVCVCILTNFFTTSMAWAVSDAWGTVYRVTNFFPLGAWSWTWAVLCISFLLMDPVHNGPSRPHLIWWRPWWWVLYLYLGDVDTSIFLYRSI